MNRRELLIELDATLDQLIENAAALHDVEESSHLFHSLHKTQESLLARLFHLDNRLDKAPESYQEKRALLSALSKKPATHKRLSNRRSINTPK